VVLEALNNPLLDVDIEGASGALIHITGGPSLSLKKAYQVFNGVTSELGDRANVKLGARIDQDFGSNIKLIGIVTGITSMEAPRKSLGIEEIGQGQSTGYAGIDMIG
jgi:cell division protein FtsZ